MIIKIVLEAIPSIQQIGRTKLQVKRKGKSKYHKTSQSLLNALQREQALLLVGTAQTNLISTKQCRHYRNSHRMPFFNKKDNKKVEESALAVRSGNAKGYQKSEEYRKGKTDVHKVKTTFDDGKGTSGKTKTKATSKVTELTNKKDLSAVSAVTETKVEGDKTCKTTNVQSNYTYSATLSGTPKEIEKEKKKLKKDMEKRKKQIQKEQKKMLKDGQKSK